MGRRGTACGWLEGVAGEGERNDIEAVIKLQQDRTELNVCSGD